MNNQILIAVNETKFASIVGDISLITFQTMLFYLAMKFESTIWSLIFGTFVLMYFFARMTISSSRVFYIKDADELMNFAKNLKGIEQLNDKK